MSLRIPENVVDALNDAGLGGRLVYIPLRRGKNASERVYEQMVERLKAGKCIDLDHYQNQVSLRTLYRLKQKAIDEFKGAHEK